MTGKEKTVTVHIHELAPIAEPSIPGYHPSNTVFDGNQFHSAMERLRSVLLGHGRERGKAAESGRSTAVAEGDEPEIPIANTPELMAEALGLPHFEQEIRKRIEEAVDRPPLRDALQVVLLEVSMAMRLYRLDDKDGAHEFLTTWFVDACRLSRVSRETQTALQQHVVTASAILYILGATAGEKARIAMELHDSLERFYCGPVDRKHASRALIPDTHAGFADALSGDLTGVDLSDALGAILKKPTRRQQLDDALTRAARGQPVPADWEVFRSPIGKRLWQALNSPHPERQVKRAPPRFEGCAFDHFAMARDKLNKFQRERIGHCIHCKRFTVNTAP